MFKLTMQRKIILLAFSAVAIACSFKIHIINREDNEGLFLLRGENRKWLTITDDLYPFESYRLLWSIRYPQLKRAKHSVACTPTDKPCTYYEWNEKSGRGFIKTLYPGGQKLIISLGRFTSSNGNQVSGLFIGGGLPVSDPDYRQGDNNETGMNYFDGSRFFHIWCNSNEGIQDATGSPQLPSTWKFLSSKILEESANGLAIVSKHQTVVNNMPLAIERTMFYETGDTYVTLNTTLKNLGSAPSQLIYVYGDEPWLGNYDTFSKGNIGWYNKELVLTESYVDTNKTNYVGMFDYGNALAGESHSFTGKANFLEWDPHKKPNVVYFANNFEKVAPPEEMVPLNSYKNRIVSLEWGPVTIEPGQSFTFSLKVGMAGNDPKSGFPIKPKTVWR